MLRSPAISSASYSLLQRLRLGIKDLASILVSTSYMDRIKLDRDICRRCSRFDYML
jgi:hypothetical protein